MTGGLNMAKMALPLGVGLIFAAAALGQARAAKPVVSIIGAGQMGSRIANEFAKAGHKTFLRDIKPEFVDKGMTTLRNDLQTLVNKGKLTHEQAREIEGRLRPTTSLQDSVTSELVLEAIVERADLKKQLFDDLQKIVPSDTIFGSNTSSIPITTLGSATDRPEKFIGIHFFNPPHLMKLVEIIRGEKTTDATTQTVMDLIQGIGKIPVEVKKDTPGFVVNRVLIPALNDAIAKTTGKGSQIKLAELDQALMEAGKHRVLPLMHEKKVGLGAYRDQVKSAAERSGDKNLVYAVEGFIDPMIADGERLVREGIVSEEGFVKAMQYGTGNFPSMPMGLGQLADYIGLDTVRYIMNVLKDGLKDKRYTPAPGLDALVEANKLGNKTGEGLYVHAKK